MTDLQQLGSNLSRARPGFWIAKGHQDLAFVQSEKTDWLAIEQASFWYAHRNRVFLSAVRSHPPRGTLFEVGAGNGSVTLALQDAGYDVVGIEPTVRFATNASTRGVRTVVCASLEDAAFADGALQNVGMFDVLEHIPDDERYLRFVRRLMPAGGRFYCAVPAWNFLWSLEDESASHQRRYRLGDLERVIGAAGFGIEYATYYFAPLVAPILLLRALPTRLRLARLRTPESSCRDHVLGSGLSARALLPLLEAEARRIERGKSIGFGASCLVVASAF